MKDINIKEPVDYVNPNIGTIGHLLTSTKPIVALPYGMAQAAPITTPGVKDVYLADKIYGFPAGPVVIMAAKGKCGLGLANYASSFDHDLEKTSPYYYSVLLEDYDINAEYSVTTHTIYYRFTFPEGNDSKILVNMMGEGSLEVVDNYKITGKVNVSGVWNYIYMEYSKPFKYYDSWPNPSISGGNNEGKANDIGVMVNFVTSDDEYIDVKIGISYISLEQAHSNLSKEVDGWDFIKVKTAARIAWNQMLGKIEVDGGTEEQRTIFYTALYRSMLHMINITEEGKYYSGFDNKVHSVGGHDFYNVDNIWDTYRCMHPLQLILEPQRQVDMVWSYIRMYEQSGWLPQFPNINGDNPLMIGNHTAAMITDTYFKDCRDFNIEKAYEAMKTNAMEITMLPWHHGPLTVLERIYMEKGFFPALGKGELEGVKAVNNFEKRQAVSVTLEHSYDDWCIAQIAKELNKNEDYDYFMKRAMNYRNVFNEQIGFMAPKTVDGQWVEDFDPKLGGGQGGRDYFTECNSWIYTFHVQHDIPGLIHLLGGRQKLREKLDTLFIEQYDVTKYEFLSQLPDATGLMGQYCQGNEPAFHIPYLYNYAGVPWKTQRKVREIMKIWYNAGPLGICGDEDGGAMSSWYVFSAMGFYPVCPGKPVYDIGSPIFDEVRINLSNGKIFTIKATNVSETNKYIQTAELNGRPLNEPWFKHSDLSRGGSLILAMGSRPNMDWG